MAILIVATTIAVLVTLVGLFGRSRIAWAMAATGFVLLVPIVSIIGLVGVLVLARIV